MILQILALVLITFLPFFELRASIPLGILSGQVTLLGMTFQGFGLPWISVFLICVITNIILGPLVYIFLDKFVHYFFRFRFFKRYYEKKVEKTQRKIHTYVEKYGIFGVALFIAVPLPGSGSYTGALGSYLLGLRYRDFVIANTIGVIIAGIAVTIITLTGIEIFRLL